MISIIIPAHNEEKSIGDVISNLQATLAKEGNVQVIVVDDGSTDSTADVARKAGAEVLRHSIRHGYGQAIRSGLSASRSDLVAIIDGDNSYRAEDLKKLLQYTDSFDMVIGARQGAEYTRGHFKYPARRALIRFCEFVTGSKIKDINSGLRVFRKGDATRFLTQLSYGFSFTTSLTVCMLLNGYFVGYVDIEYSKRVGKSKVQHLQDSLRTLQMVIEAFARYNPLKLFLVMVVGFSLFFVATSLLSLLFGLSAVVWMTLNMSALGLCLLVGLSLIATILSRRVDRHVR